MRLYIAEKPSMGQEIAKCLTGPMRRGDGFIETGDGIVTWVFGHILRQADPHEYDERYKMWRTEDLPIVPDKWKMLVADSCEKQFAIIKGLIAKADEIVHAGDPDREGQLLVDEVLDYVGNKKPVRRILLNALDERSIKTANANLRDNRDFWNLKQSALARSRADWLIGMNLSRAFTLAARRSTGQKMVLPVGRVKTPTLSLVVRREREIQNFKPVDYYGIKADFQHKNGNFTATWKPKDTMAGLDSEGRLIDKKIAEEMLQSFAEDPRIGTVSAYSKSKKQEPQKLPFSLSSLQVMAGKRFGYAPQQVLDTAQSLYEKKLTTYPRSDCEYLPTNQFGDSKVIIANLKNFGDGQIADWSNRADLSIKSRAWNDKKISAHHAIIPTRVPANAAKMSAMERNIYFLVAQAYLAQFYPPHTYNQTKVEVTYHDELFTVSGRVVLDAGWKELYGFGKDTAKKKDSEKEDDGKEEEDESVSLPMMKKNDKVDYLDGKIISKVTKPPVRFTPSTLLAAMKEIHKFVKDPEAKKKLKDVYGIGTEATRATIIEDLIKRKFLSAAGKKQVLTPTDSAYLLVDAMPDELSYPDFTAIWEDKLHSMAEGDGKLDEFIKGQIEFTKTLCVKADNMVLTTTGTAASAGKKSDSAAVIPVEGQELCPRCKKGILTKRNGKNGAFWGCSAFPRCRMTCNDKDGKPDMTDANNRLSGNRSFGGGSFTGDANAGTNTYRTPVQNNAYEPSAYDYNPVDYAPQYEPMVYSDYSAPSDEDYSVLDNYDPYAYSSGNSRSFTKFADKPKTSAMPMEKLAQKEADSKGKKKSADANKYLCPHCKEGHLRSIKGRNGTFWGCTNYPRCTSTYDDVNGMPLLGKL